MAKLESMIKETIARGARRQVRASVVPLRREVFRLRRRVASLQTTLGSLQRSAAAWERTLKGTSPVPKVSEEEAKAARLSPRLILSLRKRLGLSQAGLASLLTVSPPAVAHWEAGESMPAGPNRATLIALRKVGRREAKDMLARSMKKAEARPGRSKRARRRPRKKKKK